MTLNGAIKQLIGMHNDETMPSYFKFDIAKIINTLLMDAQEVKHGHWVENNGRYGWYCSQCKKENNYAYDYNENNVIELQDHYCPHCGARMDEE